MPTPVPDWRVTLDGTDLTSKIAPRLISLTLSERRGADSDQLDIVLRDNDGLLAIPPEGATLTLQLGWKQGTGVEPGLVDKGRFKVDEIEHGGAPDVLTLRARAVDFTADARIRKLKSYTATTLGEVLQDLAGRNGLAAQVDSGLASKPVAVLDQGRMSDMALIRRLGRQYDAVATVKAGRLLFAPIGKGQSAGGQPLPAVAIRRSDGDSHSYKRAARDKYTGATAYWHDPAKAERTGEDAGGTGHPRRLKKTYGSQADARAAAAAEHNRQQRGAATMSYTLALGRPELYPEQKATLAGFKPEIDATKWLIVETTHSLSDQGLTTALQLETAI